MTLDVKVAEAKTRPSELIAGVEAGAQGIISRGNAPVARMSRIRRQSDVNVLTEGIRRIRSMAGPATQDEIKAWRDEGRA